GEVTALWPERGDAEVQVGNFKLRARIDDLEPVASTGPERPAYARTMIAARPSVPIEIDIRGHRAEEALLTLDEYPHEAGVRGPCLGGGVAGGLGTAGVIHGRGPGALRQGVRAELARHGHVKAFRPGAPEEGGDGVTVVTLASD